MKTTVERTWRETDPLTNETEIHTEYFEFEEKEGEPQFVSYTYEIHYHPGNPDASYERHPAHWAI